MSSLPPSSYRILTYGYDAVLLDTRRLLLDQVGYQTEVAANPSEFEVALKGPKGTYGLLVLCHTVSRDEQAAINIAAKGLKTPVFQVPALIPPTEFLAHISALLT